MTSVEHLNRLDDLIVSKTSAPATADLRNALSTAREQVEALQAEYLALKNQHAVFKNTAEQTIEDLKLSYAKLEAENVNLKQVQAELQKPKPALNVNRIGTPQGY